MKKKLYIVLSICAIICSSCEDWLTQEDSTAMDVNDVYSSVENISSVVANLYSRLSFPQEFGGTGNDTSLKDIARWDECSQGGVYWNAADNVNRGYRAYYDYKLIREINIHIRELSNTATNISAEQQKYFLAEARFLRAMVYFRMVTSMGGVPIIEEVFDYTENTIELARPRNMEAEVYDYIASEVDAIVGDLGAASADIKSRATSGAALALKCRAMLYAGSLAYNYDKSAAKGLNLPSGATGIPKARANEYFQKCIDAYKALQGLGYSLYKVDSNLAANYTNLFQTSKGNPEVIFCRDYDGAIFKNSYTTKTICAAMAPALKTGCELNPTLNQVDAYERLSTKNIEPINPYKGEAPAEPERMEVLSSSYDYKVYDNPEDIFEGRDPRLAGSILTPGSSFRDTKLDFQAGLAIKNADGTYNFRHIDGMENLLTDANVYEGQRITGAEGPHFTTGYYSHTGFLIRKFVDVTAGSEAEGNSKVPYIVFRFGEVVLNAAEAAYCLSQNGMASYEGQDMRSLALELINEIRERAGGTSFRLSADELDMDRIMNERRVELAYEDHRYNDLKRWRIADEVWRYDNTNETSVLKALWPYKIYAPSDADNGKWIYRRVLVDRRGAFDFHRKPLNFDNTMYYATYPQTPGNPYIEKNPNH